MPLRIIPEKNFFGRKEELSKLYCRAREAAQGNAQSVFLSGSRGIGKTELLKQLFNYLFWKQDKAAPFYYSVSRSLLSVEDFGKDYLVRFLSQRLAFDKKESTLLYSIGLPLEGLLSILEERKALWAIELFDRYTRSIHEPIDALRIALSAPMQSTLCTGMPVIVMIDEFQQLNRFHVEGAADSNLVFCFEEPFSYNKTVHIVTGRQNEIQEMLLEGNLAGTEAQPLSLDNASALFSSLLEGYGIKEDLALSAFLNHLGGNPFYIRTMARVSGLHKKIKEEDCWRAYIREISSGSLYLYWTAALKTFFREFGRRKTAIEMLNRIYHSGETLTVQRLAKAFSLGEKDSEAIIGALYLAGFVKNEFGVLGTPNDRVLIDFVSCLHKKELLGIPYKEIEKGFIEKTASGKEKAVSFEMAIPMLKDAELVAAQCLEQIGKNIRLDPEAVSRLQTAVIEACINAAEHSKGEDKKIYLSFNLSENNIEISIESSGIKFISPETGEPFAGKNLREDPERGWGVHLMKSMADGVRFENTDRGTRVVLTKNLSGISSQRAEKEKPTGE